MWQRFDFRDPAAMRASMHAWQARLHGRPNWVWWPAIVAAVVVFVIPIILLVLAAMLVGIAVFTVLALVARGIGVLRNIFTGGGGFTRGGGMVPRDDGRRNVRVRE